MPEYPWLAAKNYGPRLTTRPIRLVVVHTIESDEKGDSAEACARYFATTDREVSAHYCVDVDSVVQCVRETDVAWCAPGANHDGIHLEHAGRARQTASDWDDAYSAAMLRVSAKLAADICLRHALPARWLTPAEVRAGQKGITSHAAVTFAYPERHGTHWDPGPGFPIERYVALVNAYLAPKPARPVSPEQPHNFYTWARWYRGHSEFKPFGPRNPAVRPNVPTNITRDRPLWWARLLLNQGGTP
jgi:N-acetyl-anhydromuramyl-L-alanine amidase AmpD